MNTAVATSLFAESNFDPFLTISYAEENGICAVQFYMSENIQKDTDTIKKIQESCKEKSIKVLCHSPFYIGNVSQNEEHFKALFDIFPDKNEKYCIFHFDEDCDINVMLDDCRKLVDFGLVPCIENFYKNKSRSGLVANMEKYLSFFDRIILQKLPVLAVLDFPRLFIEQFTNFHPIFLSELLIQKFAKQKIIVHAIDSVLPRQNREDWCCIGDGIVAYIDIFESIKRLGVFVEYAVLEYENTDFIAESIKKLEKYNKITNLQEFS